MIQIPTLNELKVQHPIVFELINGENIRNRFSHYNFETCFETCFIDESENSIESFVWFRLNDNEILYCLVYTE
jgi:hypothetical protein